MLPALCRFQQQAITAWSERHLLYPGAQPAVQQWLRLDAGKQRETAVRSQGGEHPAIRFGHQQILRLGLVVEMLHRRQLPAPIFFDIKPFAYAAVRRFDQQRAAARQRRQLIRRMFAKRTRFF
ncbi:hypothetical protein D3C80_1035350 [compost metagenome]